MANGVHGLDGLDATALERLETGASVEKRLDFEQRGHHYVGGIAYQLVRAAPEDVLDALEDPEALARMLPRTKRVTPLDEGTPPSRLELEQGNDFISAVYSVHLEPAGDGAVRFWLDRSRPHDIDDVWGYFRVERFDGERSLITVAAAVDVGSGIVRMLFEERIQALILSTPVRMRDVLESDLSRDALAAAR